MANKTHVSIPCQSNSGVQNIDFTIGYAEGSHHPIHFQSESLNSSKGVIVPESFMTAITKVRKLAIENAMDFIELVEYAVKANNPSGDDDISSSGNNEGKKDKDDNSE